MTWRDRLADPWGVLLAATAGGVAWAVLPGVALALPVGIGVAAAVYGAKVAADALLAPRSPAGSELATPELPGPTALPEPRRGTPARTLLDRAERALRALDETVESAPPSATRDQLRAVRDDAAGTRPALHRLAGQATAFADGTARIPVNRLAAERKRLIALLRRTQHDAVAAEHRAALARVEEQLAAHTRLAEAREITLARLQTTALGIESLGTRAVELLAMAAGTDHLPRDRRVDDLAGELDALRLGIAEVERRTRPALDPPDAGG
ncbi:MAG: hypothetical protein ACT4RN_09555 [Pseudonocardia sp.]